MGSGSEVRTVSGKVVAGDLTRLTDAEIVLTKDNKETTIPVSQVLSIDHQRESALPGGRFSDLSLVDGSLFHCGSLAFKGKEVELKLAGSDQKIQLPLTAISYLLNNADDADVFA